MNSVQRKAQLVVAANSLGIPVNTPFSKLVMRPEAGAARMNRDEGLSITVLSPPVDRMRTFAKWWLEKWYDDDRERSDGNAADYDIIEDFASPTIELLPSPREVVNPATAGGRDKSVANLASIVTMLELDQKRILFTADARDDLLLASLAQAATPTIAARWTWTCSSCRTEEVKRAFRKTRLSSGASKRVTTSSRPTGCLAILPFP